VRGWRWSSCERRVGELWQFVRRAFPSSSSSSSVVVGWADENCGSKTLPTSFEREDDWGCVFGLAYQAKDIVFRFVIGYSSLRHFGPWVIIIGLFLYEDF